MVFSKPPAVTTDPLYNIFTPAFSVQSVDAIVNLYDFDTDLAINYLVSGPLAGGLLRLLGSSSSYSGLFKGLVCVRSTTEFGPGFTSSVVAANV